MDEVFQGVRRIIVNQLGVEEEDVLITSNFVDDLNADSLDLPEMAMSLEEEFHLKEISDEDAEKLQSVQDVLDYLYDLGLTDANYTFVDHSKDEAVPA